MISLTNLTRNLILRQQPSVMVESMTSSFHTSSILERARRGTREKKRKVSVQNKKKKEALLLKNPPPIPYKVELMLKSKGLFGAPKPLREKDADLPIATDDVYFAKDFAYKRYPLNEALDILRLIHDPSMLNEPNGIIRIKVELDMRATKKVQLCFHTAACESNDVPSKIGRLLNKLLKYNNNFFLALTTSIHKVHFA
jgi:hypothetical protein